MISGFLQVIIILTFGFAAKSGVNSGIISSIFSSCVIFTPIIFRVKYGQKVTHKDIGGAFFIVVCIVLIGAGPAMFPSSD
jgi:drug/metabolite transporter (DMT)-like permease